MLKIKVNKDKLIDYSQQKEKFILNEKELILDISRIEGNRFHIITNNRSFRAEVIEFNKERKIYTFKINGEIIEAQVRDSLDLLMDKMGIAESDGIKINDIKAPMPGLILDIKVTEGQTVESGTNLVILEAMKMENVIKSPRQGIIKSVRVKKGQSVEKNEVLIEFKQE